MRSSAPALGLEATGERRGWNLDESLSLLRRLHASELHEQQQVVDDLQRAADQQRQAWNEAAKSAPAIAGLAAAARLRGTEVKLAAAGRSASVTTAMT